MHMQADLPTQQNSSTKLVTYASLQRSSLQLTLPLFLTQGV